MSRWGDSNKYLSVRIDEATNSTEVITSLTRYTWTKGTENKDGFFKITDPKSKRVLNPISKDTFELKSKKPAS